MDEMILIFPRSSEGDTTLEAFRDELAAAQSDQFFDVILFDLDSALMGEGLQLSRCPRHARSVAFYRGPRLTIKQYEHLVASATADGIRMATDAWRYQSMHRFTFDSFHVIGETHRDTPQTVSVGRSSWVPNKQSMTRELVLPDDTTPGSTHDQPVENSTGDLMIAKDLDAGSRVISTFDKLTNGELNRMKERYLAKDDGFLYENLVIQECVPLKHYGQATNEWRARVFDGQLFELLPNSSQPSDAPESPRWLIDKHLSESPYFELDLAELQDGDWLIIGADDGQVAGRALGQDAEAYYASLACVAKESPHLPEWIWCLVANVADLATTMPDGSVRHGTKQFSAGTKLYLTSESHVGRQDLVFVVLGKPRHRNGLIQMFMRCDRMRDFRMKQVYDKRVIEFMTRYKRGHLSLGGMSRSTWGWDDSGESREEIERWVEYFNQEDQGTEEGNEQ